MAAAPAFNLEDLIDKLYGLISVDIVIDDKINSVPKEVLVAHADILPAIVRARSQLQIKNAKELMRHIIKTYLWDEARQTFKLSARRSEHNPDHIFTLADGFNRIVLVDFENARKGLSQGLNIPLPAINNYIYE